MCKFKECYSFEFCCDSDLGCKIQFKFFDVLRDPNIMFKNVINDYSVLKRPINV